MENEKFDDVLNSRDGKSLLVKFGAAWCGPCRTMQPILERVADDWQEYVDVFSVDVDDDPDTAVRYSIRSVPTFILFSPDGEILTRYTGVLHKSAFDTLLSRYYN